MVLMLVCFFFQAEDGIRDLVRSRGLGDVYKRQAIRCKRHGYPGFDSARSRNGCTARPLLAIRLRQILSLIHI